LLLAPEILFSADLETSYGKEVSKEEYTEKYSVDVTKDVLSENVVKDKNQILSMLENQETVLGYADNVSRVIKKLYRYKLSQDRLLAKDLIELDLDISENMKKKLDFFVSDFYPKRKNISLAMSLYSIKELKNKINLYSKSSSDTIEDLNKLEKIATEKNFLVPYKFIHNNLESAKDLSLFMNHLIVEFYDYLYKKNITKYEQLDTKKVTPIFLVHEKILLLYITSCNYFIKTTLFQPFNVEVIRK